MDFRPSETQEYHSFKKELTNIKNQEEIEENIKNQEAEKLLKLSFYIRKTGDKKRK